MSIELVQKLLKVQHRGGEREAEDSIRDCPQSQIIPSSSALWRDFTKFRQGAKLFVPPV